MPRSSLSLPVPFPSLSSCVVGDDQPAGAIPFEGFGGGDHDQQKATNMYVSVCMRRMEGGRAGGMQASHGLRERDHP